MFARSTLTARPVVFTAAVLGVGAAAYYTTRPTPIRFESAVKPRTAQQALEPSPALKRTFTSAFDFTFLDLKVASVEQINHDTKKVTFNLPTKDEICGLTPGQAILTKHTPEGKWIPVFRPYTPINDLDEPGTLTLLVKHYPNGRASTHIHSLAPGSTLSVKGPLPGYSYSPSSTPRQIVLVAGGAGITPIYSLTKGILRNSDDKTNIQLVWGVNGTRDIVLGRELEELEKKYPGRLQVTYAVSGTESKPDAPSLGDGMKYRKGYVNKSIIEEVMKRVEKADGPWGDAKSGTKVFLCGPPAMEEAIAGKNAWFGGGSQGVLGELGVKKGEVYRF